MVNLARGRLTLKWQVALVGSCLIGLFIAICALQSVRSETEVVNDKAVHGPDSRWARRRDAPSFLMTRQQVHSDVSWGISGVVQTRRRAALAGASVCVVASPDLCCEPRQCVETDALGRFAFDAVPRDVRTVLAFVERHVSGSHSVAPPATDVESRQMLRLVLEPGGKSISGTVVDLTGGTVPGALVIARANQSEPVLSAGMSDNQGRFSLSVPVDRVEVQAKAEAYAAAGQETVSAPAEGVVLALVPGATIGGRVLVAASHKPVVNAVVTAVNVDEDLPSRSVSSTGQDGSFRFEDLVAGQYKLGAATSRWRSPTSWVEVAVGQATEPVILNVFPATTLDATIQVGGTPCQSGFLEMAGPVVAFETTQTNGTLHVEGLLPGPYHFSIGCLDRAHEPAAEEIRIGTEPVGKIWNLIASPSPTEMGHEQPCCEPLGTIRALVTTKGQGMHIPLALRMISRWEALPTHGVREGERFVFAKIPLGQYEVYVEQSPQTKQLVTVEKADQVINIALELPSLTEISGRALDEHGSPIPDAWVFATSMAAHLGDPIRPPSITDFDGAFRVPGLFEGKYGLRAESSWGVGIAVDVVGGSEGVVITIGSHSASSDSTTGSISGMDPFADSRMAQRQSNLKE